MVGLNKYSEKEKRAQRRRNHIARDLATSKYHQRVIQKKRVEDENGNFYLQDTIYDEVTDDG